MIERLQNSEKINQEKAPRIRLNSKQKLLKALAFSGALFMFGGTNVEAKTNSYQDPVPVEQVIDGESMPEADGAVSVKMSEARFRTFLTSFEDFLLDDQIDEEELKSVYHPDLAVRLVGEGHAEKFFNHISAFKGLEEDQCIWLLKLAQTNGANEKTMAGYWVKYVQFIGIETTSSKYLDLAGFLFTAKKDNEKDFDFETFKGHVNSLLNTLKKDTVRIITNIDEGQEWNDKWEDTLRESGYIDGDIESMKKGEYKFTEEQLSLETEPKHKDTFAEQILEKTPIEDRMKAIKFLVDKNFIEEVFANLSYVKGEYLNLLMYMVDKGYATEVQSKFSLWGEELKSSEHCQLIRVIVEEALSPGVETKTIEVEESTGSHPIINDVLSNTGRGNKDNVKDVRVSVETYFLNITNNGEKSLAMNDSYSDLFHFFIKNMCVDCVTENIKYFTGIKVSQITGEKGWRVEVQNLLIPLEDNLEAQMSYLDELESVRDRAEKSWKARRSAENETLKKEAESNYKRQVQNVRIVKSAVNRLNTDRKELKEITSPIIQSHQGDADK